MLSRTSSRESSATKLPSTAQTPSAPKRRTQRRPMKQGRRYHRRVPAFLLVFSAQDQPGKKRNGGRRTPFDLAADAIKERAFLTFSSAGGQGAARRRPAATRYASRVFPKRHVVVAPIVRAERPPITLRVAATKAPSCT